MKNYPTPADIRRALAAYTGHDPLLVSNIALLLSLPEAEQLPILDGIKTLAMDIRNMGVILAFEILIRVSQLRAKEETA